MSYQRCFSTLGCPELDVAGILDLAQRHDLQGVELRSVEGRLDLPQLFAERYGDPAAMADRFRDHPVRIVSLDTSLQLFTNTPADREEMLAFVPWAEALGTPWLRWFDGGHDAAAEIDAAVDTWEWWQARKKENGWQVGIMIETHDSLLNADAINLLMSRCPGLKILWDTHHTWKIGHEDPVKTWAEIQDHVVHLHVKDSVSIPGPQHPFTYRLPGNGEFPMPALRAAMGHDFTGMMSLEWERHWHPDLDPLDPVLASANSTGWW